MLPLGEQIEITSTMLGETRPIYIYVPQGLWGMDEDMTNLPVIYVLDAESQFDHTATTVDFLSIATNGNDFIPRSIVVGIPNTADRTKDLTPVEDTRFETSGGGGNFLEFIAQELIPFIDAHYSTSAHRTIIGHSFGGLIAFEALLRKRELFDNYIAVDPGFGIAGGAYLSEVIDTLSHCDLRAENIFCGIANNRPMFLTQDQMMADTSEFIKSFGQPNQRLVDAHQISDWLVNLTIEYYDDENHYSIPHRSTYDGLRALYDFYTFPEMTGYYHPAYKDRTDLVERLKDHYQKASARLGYEVVPMQGYLNSFAYGLSHFDREDLAIDLLEYNIELHPDNPVVYNNLGYFYMTHGYRSQALGVYRKSIELKMDEEILQTIQNLQE